MLSLSIARVMVGVLSAKRTPILLLGQILLQIKQRVLFKLVRNWPCVDLLCSMHMFNQKSRVSISNSNQSEQSFLPFAFYHTDTIAPVSLIRWDFAR